MGSHIACGNNFSVAGSRERWQPSLLRADPQSREMTAEPVASDSWELWPSLICRVDDSSCRLKIIDILEAKLEVRQTSRTGSS